MHKYPRAFRRKVSAEAFVNTFLKFIIIFSSLLGDKKIYEASCAREPWDVDIDVPGWMWGERSETVPGERDGD